MPRPPKQTKSKPIPETEEKIVQIPKETEQVSEIPGQLSFLPDVPKQTEKTPETPEAKPIDKPIPSELEAKNCVIVMGQTIEIKPTKLKYFRNHTASFYSILKAIPLTEFLNFDKGVFDKDRDADQILFDFLIAVFDDAEFVKTNYDNMTVETVDSVVRIFGRINGIDEKEEQARKNREAQAKEQENR